MWVRYLKAVIGGIVATGAMTLIMLNANVFGLPKADPAAMMAGLTHTNMGAGWLMHFGIGILFAILYAGFFNGALAFRNDLFRGLMYGIVVFIIAQFAMGIMAATNIIRDTPGNAPLWMMMLSSFISHLVYGAVLGLFFDKEDTGDDDDDENMSRRNRKEREETYTGTSVFGNETFTGTIWRREKEPAETV